MIGSYTDLYQKVKKYATKTIYCGEADDLINTKVETLAESQEFIQDVI